MKKTKKTEEEIIKFVTDFFKEKPDKKFETVLFIENKNRELLLGLFVGDLSFDDFQHFIIATGNSLATGSLLGKIDAVHTATLVKTVWFKKKGKDYNISFGEEAGGKEGILVSMMNAEKKGISTLYSVDRKGKKTKITFKGDAGKRFFDHDNSYFWEAYNGTKDIWKDLDDETKSMAEVMSLGVIKSLLQRHI